LLISSSKSRTGLLLYNNNNKSI